MMKAKLTEIVTVECPYCNGENEIEFNDFGCEVFPCQFSHCNNFFEIPEFIDFAEIVNNSAEKYAGQ